MSEGSAQAGEHAPASEAERAPPLGRRRAVEATAELASRDGILVLLVGIYALGLLVIGARDFYPDAWLPVVAGREIVEHGLPAFDHLTVLGAGRRWVDQQWLAQLVLYGVYELGGMRLVVLVGEAIAAGAAVAAVAIARLRGATTRSTAWIVLVAGIPFLGFAANPRAQTLVYPLFVALVWLVTGDSRAPSNRVFWLLPLLVLWANLHGSVVLAAGLVSLHGLLGNRRSTRSRALLALAPWACVLASPYVVHLPAYYRDTVLDPPFAGVVTEWLPTTLTPLTVPFFVLAAGSIYLFGRARDAFSRSEVMLLLVTAVAAFHALRNTVWFALVCIVVLPAALDRVLAARVWSPRFNRLAAVLGVAALAAGLVSALSRASVGTFPEAASRSVVDAAGDRGRVFADPLYGDWLLATEPSLRGRVAFDIRFELLPRSTHEDLVWLRLKAVGVERFARDYRVFALDREADDDLIAALRRRGYRTVYRHGELVVLARRPGGTT